jgi:hypothetical protein
MSLSQWQPNTSREPMSYLAGEQAPNMPVRPLLL